MAEVDFNQPAMVMVPDMIPGHDVPAPPVEGQSLAECLAYVVRYVPREHWDEVTINAGAGAEARQYRGDDIETLAGKAGDEGLPQGVPTRERT